ncbi:hypothetical protein [Mycolicibacterium litorale]|uniref:Uncharacterized protein n=1 Tax=Mycolicibacterium litorale TaxID=758802 RepID=A0AAD1ISL7_9MYCO|nr:hypothetical protein [Mycolicibacterium litorale]MCV7415768.1 hypothetical protein [Mycolicibacterium litorale]BBY16953.1 hypothetical protein MLIT_25450 [Mycolicibacterium litorale]
MAVQWQESHGTESSDMGEAIPFLALPDIENEETTRVMISAIYDTPGFPVGTKWDASFDLPDGATLEKCATLPGLTCKPEDSKIPAGQGRTAKVVRVTGEMADEGPYSQTQTNALLIRADISGPPGLIFSKSRTKALVRYPTVVVRPSSGPPEDPNNPTETTPIEVMSQVMFDRANGLSWSEPPAASAMLDGMNSSIFVNGERESLSPQDSAQWLYTMYDGMPLSIPAISGTDDDVIEQDSQDLFYAGVWFGIAGGTAVTGLQQVIVGWPNRKRMGELWRRFRRRE